MCRELIHTALERECEDFMRKIKKIADVPRESEKEYKEENGVEVEGPWHKGFIEVFEQTYFFDKRLQNLYDGLSSSRYPIIIIRLLKEGWLSEEEVSKVESLVKYMV